MDDAARPAELTLPPGSRVMRQGEISQDVYYWLSGGSVRILVDDRVVRELAYDPAVPCFFGDLAAILGRQRSSSVETVTENRFLRVRFAPGSINPLVHLAPHAAQQWLVSLARTAYESIDALKQRQQPLDAARERLKALERQDAANRKKWSGVLFVTEKLHSRAVNPHVGSLLRYFQRIKLYDQETGRPPDVDPRLFNADLRKYL